MTETFEEKVRRLIREMQDACWARTKAALEQAMGVTNG